MLRAEFAVLLYLTATSNAWNYSWGNSVMVLTTLDLCMMHDWCFLLLYQITKHLSSSKLRGLTSSTYCRLRHMEIKLVLKHWKKQDWNLNSIAFKAREIIVFPSSSWLFPSFPFFPTLCPLLWGQAELGLFRLEKSLDPGRPHGVLPEPKRGLQNSWRRDSLSRSITIRQGVMVFN